jgi:hypothetical protein
MTKLSKLLARQRNRCLAKENAWRLWRKQVSKQVTGALVRQIVLNENARPVRHESTGALVRHNLTRGKNRIGQKHPEENNDHLKCVLRPLPVKVRQNIRARRLPGDTETRCAQELLTSAIRPAQRKHRCSRESEWDVNVHVCETDPHELWRSAPPQGFFPGKTNPQLPPKGLRTFSPSITHDVPAPSTLAWHYDTEQGAWTRKGQGTGTYLGTGTMLFR